ncbi:tRNA glutamyl-Q(34) synthetase GluQRS [Gorillibacterium timonense]|uniref:tRNA glutamyl-Q(34) synthetase GluQRS n=1 Tax=Gorillibacterium timonense TaxID=1689269 RepID=UPI00071D8E1D|nr:tRNA glutamyl-Q(34) synthetase GluQRS [Gorillibacterium timonense]
MAETASKRRGRFAPTPSGSLHLGNARTALLAWLQIRAAGGEFILRMEDIDKPRSRAEWAEEIIRDLEWLGLDFDEGPKEGGPYGPYVQSEREDRYREALDRLQAGGYLYPCYCSRADLAGIASAPHGIGSEGPVYPGTCRRLSEEERRMKAASKEPSLRFVLPNQEITVTDGLLGEQLFLSGAGGDFVVRRADGIIAYQLAVVVDDADMEITDVLRGMDLLDSTPRQLLLFEALGEQAPNYVHVPLLYGPDGSRLSKRHGAVGISSMRRSGRRAEEVVGCLAYWSGLLEQPEPVRASELINSFCLSRVPKEPVRLEAELLRKLAEG